MTILLQGAGIQALTVAPSGSVPILDLQSDQLVLSDNDPVGTWDGTNGHIFTASGTDRPTYHSNINGYPEVVITRPFSKMDSGESFADNPTSMTIIYVLNPPVFGELVGYPDLLTKESPSTDPPEWDSNGSRFEMSAPPFLYIVSDAFDTNTFTPTSRYVITHEIISQTEVHSYYNGSNANEVVTYPDDPFPGCSNSDSVKIGTQFAEGHQGICAARIYVPALSSTQRAAVEVELAARYGVTL